MEEKKSEWISVKDRLPEIEVDVIISHIKDKWVCTGHIDSYNKKWYNQFDSAKEEDRPCFPTHWQPLPESPKE